MTPYERLRAAVTGQPVDRTPVSLYEIDGFGTRYSPDHPSYATIRAMTRERLDNMVMETPSIPGPLGFLYTGGDEDIVSRDITQEESGTVTVTSIETPKGPLRMVTRDNPEAYTTWITEYLLKDEDDVDRLLSLPYKHVAPDFGAFDRLKERTGSNGIMLPDLIDPMGMIAGNMDFDRFLLLSVLNREKFRALLDFFAERMTDFVDDVLEHDSDVLFRIVGPEVCTPPYMPPVDFGEFIVGYDKPLIERIHRAGALVRVHCHGRIALVADMFREMGPDAIDPIEEPPGGDIMFEDAKRRLGGDICLMGNIQESLFELHTPEEVRDEVKRIVEIGKEGGRYVLMPTATPITVPLPQRLEENIIAYIETGLAHG